MKCLVTLVCAVLSFTAFTQHKVQVAENSDFKTIQNDLVTSTFVFDAQPSANAIQAFDNWSAANGQLGAFDESGLILTTTFKTALNDRNVYSKMFYLLEIDVLEVTVNGQKKMMDKEQFFANFNL